MNHSITLTSEDLIREALKAYKNSPTDAASLLIATAKRVHPEQDAVSVRLISQENSLIRGIAKIERERAAAESEFERIGQMSLFGALIQEHAIPKSLLEKSAAEVQEWGRTRARVDSENAEEARRHAEAAIKHAESKERKAQRSDHNSRCYDQVVETLCASGIDPAGVTYAEAISQAQSLFPGDQPLPVSQTERPLR